MGAYLGQADRSMICPLWNISKQTERDEVYEERRIRSRDAELLHQMNEVDSEMVFQTKKRPPISMLSQLIDQIDNDEESFVTNFERLAGITTSYLLAMPCLSDPKMFNAIEIFHAVETLNSTEKRCECDHVSKVSEEFSEIWNNEALQWENKLFIAVMFTEVMLRIITNMPHASESSCLVKGLLDVIHGCVVHYLKAPTVKVVKCNMCNNNQPVDQTFASNCSRLQERSKLESSFDNEMYYGSQVLGETHHSTRPKIMENGLILESNDSTNIELNYAVSLNELRSYLVKDHYLHQKIVAYIPLELNEVYQKLHEEGIYIPKHQLLKALDALSIFVSTH